MESTKNKNRNKSHRREMCLICGLNFNPSLINDKHKEKQDQVEMNNMYRIFCTYFHVSQEMKEDAQNGDGDKAREKPSEFLKLQSSKSSKMNSSNQTRRKRKRARTRSKKSMNKNFIEAESETETETETETEVARDNEENLSFPFCPDCRESVVKLSGLNEQLIMINKNIQTIHTQISSKIIQSQSQSQQVHKHVKQTKNKRKNQVVENQTSMRNVLKARRRIFTRWNPTLKLQKLEIDKQDQNLHITRISVPVSSPAPEPVPVPVSTQEDVQSAEPEKISEDETPITPTTETSTLTATIDDHEQSEIENEDENEIMILNDMSNERSETDTETETDIQFVKEILHASTEDTNISTVNDNTSSTSTISHTEGQTTPKPLKSILKTSANLNDTTTTTTPTTPTSTRDSNSNSSSSSALPRRVVQCPNGKFLFGGYSFFKCVGGFLCGVARCSFVAEHRNKMLSHVIQQHACKSKYVHQRFPPYNCHWFISSPSSSRLLGGGHHLTTPQRKLPNQKPRRTKLSFSHKIAIKIEKLTDSTSSEIENPLPLPVSTPAQDPVPVPVNQSQEQEPQPSSSSSAPASSTTSPSQIPYVKIEKLKDNKLQNKSSYKSNHDRNRKKVHLSKAMALLMKFQK